MVLKRLTKTQKAQIVEAYSAGENTNDLAEKYNCSSNTINRTVKTFLSDSEYKSLKEKRSKISSKNLELTNKEICDQSKEDLEKVNSIMSDEEKSNDKDNSKTNKDYFYQPKVIQISSLALEDANDFGVDCVTEIPRNESSEIEKVNQDFENNFEEIAPLETSFDFDLKQKLEFQVLNYESLPETVYMLVDKKVELDYKLISDLPEWSFLPDNELKRNAILLFSNQRSAKRSCSKNQRVIKIPNTSVFSISKPYLVSKGITRLILDDSIIGLDN